MVVCCFLQRFCLLPPTAAGIESGERDTHTPLPGVHDDDDDVIVIVPCFSRFGTMGGENTRRPIGYKNRYILTTNVQDWLLSGPS